MSQPFYLAQFNITKLKRALDDPIMKEFTDFLAPVNQLAEESPGFVWRLKDENGTAAIDIETPYEDPSIFVNMSVWKNLASLKAYTYETVHSYFLKNRKKWSDKLEGHQVVLWWIQEGHIPTLDEAKSKLALLATNGPSQEAFTFNQPFDPA